MVKLVIAVWRNRLHEWIGTVIDDVVGDTRYAVFVIVAHHFSRLSADRSYQNDATSSKTMSLVIARQICRCYRSRSLNDESDALRHKMLICNLTARKTLLLLKCVAVLMMRISELQKALTKPQAIIFLLRTNVFKGMRN